MRRRSLTSADRRAPWFALGFSLAAGISQAAEIRAIEVWFVSGEEAGQPLERYQALKEVSGTRGIQVTRAEGLGALATENLAAFDVVLLLGGDQELPADGFAALLGFVRDGGGLVPVHTASGAFQDHEGYVKLVGGRSTGHGVGSLTARVVAPAHPTMRDDEPYETWGEIRRHEQLADDLTILQRHGEEPWTWVREEGEGRVFHSAYGHEAKSWREEGYHDLLERGIRWAAGDGVRPPELPELRYETPLLPAHYQSDVPVPKVQEPLPPEESLKLAQVPPGFEISLFAAEPDVVRPIAMTWDGRGRLWVVESLDYPNGLSLGETGNDRVKICEDSTGDGRADRFTVFADGLSIATSLVLVDGGLIVSDGSRILWLKDSDGDDRADERRVLFEGIRTHDTHAGVSNLRLGMDGWVYATIGYAGFDGMAGGARIRFDTGAFRFQPDGSALEFLAGTTNNTWGLGFTSHFDILGSTANRQPSWQVVGDGGPARLAHEGTRFFPITLDVMQSDGWEAPLEALGDGRLRAKARHFTAAAGHGIYTAGGFPESWHDRIAMVCEPAGHLVALGRMETRDADFHITYDGNHLYASADAWSAPVAVETGPDGAVWIADWYNIIVQHNRPGAPHHLTAVERGAGAAYLTPLREKPFGRIYRVAPRDMSPESPPAGPLEGLSHPNLFWRLHSQRLIIVSEDRGQEDALKEIAFAADGRAGDHALRALHGLGLPLPDGMFSHPDPGRRRTALALWDAASLPPLDLLEEEDPFVIREWLLLASRLPADESLGRRLREWHGAAPRLHRGEVLERCFALAAARHAVGYFLAWQDELAERPNLEDRVGPAVLSALAKSLPPQVMVAIEEDDSFLAASLRHEIDRRAEEKSHRIPAERLARGSTIYERHCLACHQRDGSGVDAAFPPLDGSPRLLGEPDVAIRILLHGMIGPVEVPGRAPVDSVMPPLPDLSEEEIADVLSYARHAWSNDAAPVSAAEVRASRRVHAGRAAPWTAAELD